MEKWAPMEMDVAILGGGCFWCTEAIFASLEGVSGVLPGYCGGHVAHPTYEQVCGKQTGHIEVVRVEFDPAKLSFAHLLQMFFSIHDPTTVGRQGHDIGPQYASVIFWQTDHQRQQAEQMLLDLEREGIYGAPIVTRLLPPAHFWPAEAYHHNYFVRHSAQTYCELVIAPKLAKFRQQFADRLRRDDGR